MSAVYLDDYTLEAYVTAGWIDITDDAISSPLSGDWGITDNTAIDLIADAGSFNFTLNNIGDEYIPGHSSSIAGWDINTPIRLKCTFEGADNYFRFYISSLDIVSEKFNRKRVGVSCVDYIEYMSRTPLIGQTVGESQTADQGITTLVSGLQSAPQATSYQTGNETFVTIFSGATPRTRVYSEVAKLVKSEFGYFYNTKDRENGETLVFENNQNRNGLRTLDTIQASTGDALLLETGDFLLLETGDKLLLSQAEDAVLDNSMKSVSIQYGKDIVNYFKTTTYPTGVTAGLSTLWSLSEPIEMGPGETITFRTNYSDSTGGNQINCLTSDATSTTKSLRENKDGSGTNRDAFLTVSASFGSEGVIFTLTNTYTETCYVTALTALGTGLLLYDSVISETEDASSQASYDVRGQSINQEYQQTPDIGFQKGKTTVEFEREPRVDLQKVTFNANRSVDLMHAFLDLDVGNLVHIKEDDSEIDGYYYIQAKEFSIGLGGLINFSWIVRGMYPNLREGGLTSVAIEFGGTGSSDRVYFGRLPYLTDVKARSFAMWAYIEPSDGNAHQIVTMSGSTAGVRFGNSSDDLYIENFNLDTTQGRWRTTSTYTTQTWMHIGYTLDVSSDPLADPIIYINGSPVAITETITPAGAYKSEKSSQITIGGVEGVVDGLPFDGKLADVRIYNEVLSSADFTTLYNGGDPDASGLTTDSLVFQALCQKTGDYVADYTLTSSDRIIDNIFGIIGVPNGGEIVRAFP